MIASIRGELQEKGSGWVIVEAGGLGYQVQVSRMTLQALGAPGGECRLWTHFHVREDNQQLFGFADTREREAFQVLLTVKGVGPRLALAILSEMTPNGLRDALLRGETASLNQLPGVGKKLAERLAVELKDKAAQLGDGEPSAAGASPAGPADGPAIEALQKLGFSLQQSRKAVGQAYQTLGDGDHAVEDVVKSALKMI